MFRQLPMYQQQGASAFRKDLVNTHLLAEYLGHPESGLVCIHVAGTNGKGSVSHMLASVFQEAGYKTGLYTSPHLKDFRERIKINGREISEDFVTAFIAGHRGFFEAQHLSFFEMSVGLAFDYFRKEETDIAIIETGLGGRLDATNIVTPLVSVITNIGMDHMQFLGNTLEEIAGEKAGIIKANVPVVIGEYTSSTRRVFEAKAAEVHAPVYLASDLQLSAHESGLKGLYQQHNIRTVQQAIAVVREVTSFAISENHLKAGLLNVIPNTGLRGRWDILGQNPTIVADTAHNAEGLAIVMEQVKTIPKETLRMVIGVVNDKDLDSILPLFPKDAVYYFSKPDLPRGLDAHVLQEAAAKYGLTGVVYGSVKAAYENAVADAGVDDFVYVGGSTFVVGEVV